MTAGQADGAAADKASADGAARARQMWMLAEPVHVVTYFTAEGRAAYEAAGLRGFWRGYFAGRAGALGPVGAAPVIAAFYGFAPPMVERALPAVWQLISPEAAMAARTAGAVAALRRVLDGAGLASDGAPTEAVADELYSDDVRGGLRRAPWRSASRQITQAAPSQVRVTIPTSLPHQRQLSTYRTTRTLRRRTAG